MVGLQHEVAYTIQSQNVAQMLERLNGRQWKSIRWGTLYNNKVRSQLRGWSVTSQIGEVAWWPEEEWRRSDTTGKRPSTVQ